jgi:hypothetical protein
VALLQAAVDSGAFANVTTDAEGNFTFNTALVLDGSADGRHTVHLRAADNAGNVSGVTNLAFTLDTQAPAVSISGPTPGGTSTSNVTVTGQVTDSLSGAASLQAALDGGVFSNVSFDSSGNFSYTTGLPLDGSADGSHTVHLRATDKTGNTSGLTDLTFTLSTGAADTTRPVFV